MLQTPLKDRAGAFALIALGSNAPSVWGDATQTVLKAIHEIEDRVGAASISSPLYRTPAFPAGAGPEFVNAAIRIESTHSGEDLLAVLHEIEAEAGRERIVRWGQRTLDLDLIALGAQVLPDASTHKKWRELALDVQAKIAPDQLVLPHPRLQDRAFVLVPLAQVAPDWVHPILDRSVTQMRDARPAAEVATVRLI